MKKEVVFSVITIFLFAGLVSAVSFQGLGGVEAETLVREKYRSMDDQVWVGRGPNTGMNDLNVELALATPFGPYSSKVAVRWGAPSYEWEEIAVYNQSYETRWSAANAISSDGSTIVGFTGDGLDVVYAFRWTRSGGTQLLNDGHDISVANDISDDGLIVGHSVLYQGMEPTLACAWEGGENLVDLKQWLSNNYNLNIGTWTLTNAIGISTDGSTIVGYGINPDGNYEDWIATIPEPCTLLLLGMGVLALRRRRHQ